MSINKFLDKYYAFLVKSRFTSAEAYRKYILDVYNNIPGAKSLLNKLSKETDNLKLIKTGANLVELVYYYKIVIVK